MIQRNIAWMMNGIQRATDNALRSLLTSLPINWQHALRDRGFIRILSDLAAITMAPTIVLTAPRVAYCTLRYWLSSRFIRIKETKGKIPSGLEIHQLRAGTDNHDIEKGNARCRKRVLLFVHGGAWGSGQLWQYRDVAVQYGKLLEADTVLLFKYSYYPESCILQQKEALLDAIQYIHSAEFQYNELKICKSEGEIHYSQVELVVCGHSSGAHLAVLSAVELFRKELVFLQSRNEKNIQQLARQQPFIHAIIGLSGPFDLVKHFDFESARGVQHVSPMLGAAGDTIEGLANCSPDVLLSHSLPQFFGHQIYKDLIQLGILDDSVRLTRIYLLHGTEDTTVPHEASERMEEALKSAGFQYVHGYYYPGHHLQPILDVILTNGNNDTKRIIKHIASEL